MPSEVKPAFGQVWEWMRRGPFMLIAPKGEGLWTVIWLNQWGFVSESPMAGLRDDPSRRIDGYELLSEVES